MARTGEDMSALPSGRESVLPQAPRPGGLDVLFVLNSLAVGGSESKVVRLVNSLFAQGVQGGVAYLNGPYSLLKQINPDIPAWYLSRKGKFSFAATAALRQLITEQKPRTVVSVNLYPALYVVTATRWLRERPKTIGLMNTTSLRRGVRWRRRFYGRVLRALDWTVYGCEAQRRAWLSERNPMLPRSCVIYNGVDVRQFSPGPSGQHQAYELRARHGIDQNAFVVGTVGRLAPEKNQRALIDALADARISGVNMHLLLAGDGPMRGQLEQHAGERGVASAVTFMGQLTDVRAALRMLDVFVLPSATETFSNAALEAMAMRIPVILTRTGGAPEMISDGEEGYILGVEEIATRLPKLLSQLRNDIALRARMGSAAVQRAQQRFSWDAMVEEYKDVLGCRRGNSHA